MLHTMASRYLTVQITPIVVALTMLATCAFGQQKPDYSKGCSSTGCHDGYAKLSSIHAPVEQDACDACHESDDEASHAFELSAELDELCAECHDELIEDFKFLHGPVAAGECTSCHSPHASEHDTLLLAEGAQVCTKCHTDIALKLSKSAFVHQPAAEDCLTCHNPHGSDHKMILNSSTPELCYDCHDAIEEGLDDAAVTHQPVTTGRNCVQCHDPHGGPYAHGLVAEGAALCLTCHNKSYKSDAGVVADIAKKLKENPNHHGPVAQGDCLACHAPHFGEHFRLLADAYPSTFYEAFEEDAYALCFGCHDVEAFEDAETDDTTEFRNGEQNLHYVHVNKETKGRTCRVCHDVHASKQEKQIAERVPFGGWSIPIRFAKTETGGSCAPGCHKPYRYDRDQAVLNLPAPQANAPEPDATP